MSLADKLYGPNIDNNSSISASKPRAISSVAGTLQGKATPLSFSRGTWLRDLKIYLDNSFSTLYDLINKNNTKSNNFPMVATAPTVSSPFSPLALNNPYSTVTPNLPVPISKAEQLRKEDDDKQAQTEAFEKAIEESKTIKKINESLLKLTTGVKIKGDTAGDSGSWLALIPLMWGAIKNAGKFIYKFLAKIPGVELAVAFIGDLVSKIPGISDITGFISKQVGNVIDFVKDFKVSDIIKGITESVSKVFDSVLQPIKSFLGLKDVAKVAEDGAKLAKPVSAGVEALAKPIIEEGAKEAIAKTTVKSIFKKIPIIGALAGIGFAIPRLLKGDYLGASMEVASGLTGATGVGIAASLGIDAALVARDLHAETEAFKVGADELNMANSKKILESTKDKSAVSSNTSSVNYYNQITEATISEDEADLIRASQY